MGEFVTVANVSELEDGELYAYEIGGRMVAVATVDGAYYAFDDTCTHAFCSLSQGDLEGNTVVCPCHMGTYDVTSGTVVSGPPPQPVRTYPVRVEGDQLQIDAEDGDASGVG
jgi:nitrite reductase/ring-hydroxylating ferredoxin subunit